MKQSVFEINMLPSCDLFSVDNHCMDYEALNSSEQPCLHDDADEKKIEAQRISYCMWMIISSRKKKYWTMLESMK